MKLDLEIVMVTAERKIYRGHTIPYGTLADASYEVKQAFYYHGYKNDDDLPELPGCADLRAGYA